MTKSGRRSPAVGRGENLASHDAIRKALAMEILDQERLDREKEFRKRHRAGAEKSGVNLSKLDMLFKRREDQPNDILADIKSTMHYLGAVILPLRKQYDMFVTASESVEAQNAAWRAGEMAGLNGKPAQPPANLVGEDAQLWLEGHGIAAKVRAEVERERKAEEKAEAERIAAEKAEAGAAIDGTNKGSTASQVRAQAAADFAKDNPDVKAPAEPEAAKGPDPVPAGDGIFDGDGKLPDTSTGYAGKGERYMLSTDETYASGRRAAYEDGKPVGSSIPGKVPVYADHPPAVKDDGFEATEEELAAQAGRPSRQEGPEIDEAEIAAAAKKLKESGFVPEKPKRGARRLPGERTSQ